MSNIHFLGEKPADLGEPNEWLVKILSDMLERAKTGELQTILGCGRTSDGEIITMFTAAAKQDYYQHLGALESLKLDFVRRVEAG